MISTWVVPEKFSVYIFGGSAAELNEFNDCYQLSFECAHILWTLKKEVKETEKLELPPERITSSIEDQLVRYCSSGCFVKASVYLVQSKVLVGQKLCINSLARFLKVCEYGLSPAAKTIFMMGPRGVGKTELAQTVARIVHNSTNIEQLVCEGR